MTLNVCVIQTNVINASTYHIAYRTIIALFEASGTIPIEISRLIECFRSLIIGQNAILYARI